MLPLPTRPAGGLLLRPPAAWPRPPRFALGVVALLAGAVLALGCLYPFAACALGLATAAFAAWAVGRTPADRAAPPPVVWPFALLAGVCLLQTIPLPLNLLAAVAPHNADVWARALAPVGGPAPAFAPLSLAPELTRVETVKWLTYAAFAWMGALWVRRFRLESVAHVVLGLAFVVGLITLFHGAFGVREVYGFYEPRITFPRWRIGPLLNANHLSGYLNLGVFAGLGLLLATRRQRTARTALLLVATCGLIMGVVLLASRAAVALLVVGAVASLPLARGRGGRDAAGPNAVLWVVGLLVLGVLLALFGYREHVVNDLRDRDVSKLYVARDSLALVRDHWAFGVGRGAFEGAFFAYKKVPDDLNWTHPENIAAQWAGEWGLPASIAALALFARAFVVARAWRARTVGRVLALALGVLVLHNFADFSLEVPGVAALAAFVAGALTGRRRADDRDERRGENGEGQGGGRRGEGRDGAADGRRGGERRGGGRDERSGGGGRRRPALAWAPAASLAALAVWAGAWQPKLPSELRQAAFDLARAEPADTSFVALEGYMRRFPAEPYFPLAGGLLAVKRRAGEGLPWFNRALERAPEVSAVHSALADVFSALRLRSQALLEVRLAALANPAAAGRVARFAGRLGGPVEDLLGAVPSDHEAYPAYLEGVLGSLPPDSDLVPAVRAALLDKQPCSLAGRSAEARARLREALDPGGECADEAAGAACRARLEDELDRLARCPGGAETAAFLRVDWGWARGDRQAVLAELDALCAHASSNITGCFERLAERAAEAHDLERMNRAMRAVAARRCTGAEGCAAAWGWTAEVHLRHGDPASAFAAAGRAVDASPGDLRARRLYAETAVRIGAFERAVRAYEYIVEHAPRDAAARARLAAVRERMAAEPARAKTPPAPTASAPPRPTQLTIPRAPGAVPRPPAAPPTQRPR